MTRFTKFEVGELVHCIQRGVMGVEIFKDESDYWRFVRLLYLCNDQYVDRNMPRIETTLGMFERPNYWPERNILVDILVFVAMPNHFHILLRQRVDGGIAKFMHRLSSSITKGYNSKYNNQGTIFQSRYQPISPNSEEHFDYLISYINVKNVCELYPLGGIKGAYENYDDAYEWAKTYKFSSLRSWAEGANSPILNMVEINKCRAMADDSILQFYKDEEEFKKYAFETVETAYRNKVSGKIEDFEIGKRMD